MIKSISLSRLSSIWEGRIAAIAADCKSATFGFREFESHPSHQEKLLKIYNIHVKL